MNNDRVELEEIVASGQAIVPFVRRNGDWNSRTAYMISDEYQRGLYRLRYGNIFSGISPPTDEQINFLSLEALFVDWRVD